MIKLIIIGWFVGMGLLFLILRNGFDKVYENVYFKQLTPEKQEIVMNWIKSEEL